MCATVAVPPALNVILRDALIDGIGDVAEDLSDLIIPLRDRASRPDRFDGPFDRLERIRALLADLGWGDSEPGEAAWIDLKEHGRALSDALDKALAVAGDDLEEADDVDRERQARGEPPIRTQKERRASELRELRASVTRPASAEPTAVRSRRRSLRFRCCGVQVCVSSRVSLRQRRC